ncbi:MAG: hypothetical protein ABIO82_07330 [Ginsengibacter sp.]
MKKLKLPRLSFCILFDIIGFTSYLLPVIGEAEDILWAPISGIIFYLMFGKRMGVFGGVFSFLEEILPGLDFIPTFTIAWFIRRREIEKLALQNQVALSSL